MRGFFVAHLRLWCALLAALAIAGTTRSAGAEPGVPDEPIGGAEPGSAPSELQRRKLAARERFARGLEFANAARWDAALAEFIASREIYSTRVATRNAAVALTHLERFARAHALYAALLLEFGAQMSEPEHGEIQAEMDELRENVGEIEIEGAPSGSGVVIDAEQRGTTPLGPLLVDAGTRSLRVSKPGHESYETQIVIAGRQRRTVIARLPKLRTGGTLVVTEADGRSMDLSIDGGVVGKTPWRGNVSVGRHSLALSGEDELGTPPIPVLVRDGQTTTLALRAQRLDSELRVEPVPSNARVDIDGVHVGSGVWQGRLPSGSHRVEVSAEGHVPYRRELRLSAGRREVVKLMLERDVSNPIWKGGRRSEVYFEIASGLALASSFAGTAESGCGREVEIPTELPNGGAGSGCSSRSRPLGFLGSGRVGYRSSLGLGLELFGGYARVVQSLTRRVRADVDPAMPEPAPFFSDDFRDRVRISGALAGFSASYGVFERTPLLARFSLGVMRARIQGENRGSFSGALDGELFTRDVTVPEQPLDVWIPFVGPELRFGYRLIPRLTLDLGIAALFMLPSRAPRGGRTLQSTVEERNTVIVDENQVGRFFSLPREESVGSFVLFAPSIGVRLEL